MESEDLLDKESRCAEENNNVAADDEKKCVKLHTEVVETRCGLLTYRPKWIQVLANVKLFTFCISMFSLVQGIVVNGCVQVVIPSLEKEFGLSSRQSGIVVAGNDVSAIILICLVSFYGSKANKPKWLAYGAFITGLGCFLFALPKLLIGEYMPSLNSLESGGLQSTTEKIDICKVSSNNTIASQMNKAPLLESCEGGGGSEMKYVLIFFLANFIMGAGTTPLYTLAPAYIDENVSPDYTPVYLGVWHVVTMLGPGLGFMTGGMFLKVFTNVQLPLGLENLSYKDPRWIGAWWLPFISLSCLLFVAGVILLFFPYQMPSGKKKREKAIAEGEILGEDKNMHVTLKGLFQTTLSLLTNKTYLFAVMGVTIRTIYPACIVPFLTKITVIKFGVQPQKAGMFIGTIIVPSMMIGISIGSFIMKRVPVKGAAKTAALICAVTCVSSALSPCMYLLPGCNNTNLAGVVVPYHNQSSTPGLVSSCNSGCDCSPQKYQPLCGSDGVTYHNPCFAGCQQTADGNGKNSTYFNCKCIARNDMEEEFSQMIDNTATTGVCDRDCKNKNVYLVIVMISITVSFIKSVPFKMICIRSVHENQRAFALGLSFLVMRLFSWMPAPVVYGGFIDSTCLAWGYDSCGRRKNCLEYDVDRISTVTAILGIVTSAIGACMYVLAWWCYKPLNIDNENGDKLLQMDPADDAHIEKSEEPKEKERSEC